MTRRLALVATVVAYGVTTTAGVLVVLAYAAERLAVRPRPRHALRHVDPWVDPDPYGLQEGRHLAAHLAAAERGEL